MNETINIQYQGRKCKEETTWRANEVTIFRSPVKERLGGIMFGNECAGRLIIAGYGSEVQVLMGVG